MNHTREAAASPERPPQALVYVRVARRDYRHLNLSELSITKQRAACARLADALGVEVIEEYVDHGASGAAMARPGLSRLLARVREDRGVEHLIVSDVSRLGRSDDDLARLHDEISRAGVRLAPAAAGGGAISEGRLAFLAGVDSKRWVAGEGRA